jgi:hypothetical protein
MAGTTASDIDLASLRDVQWSQESVVVEASSSNSPDRFGLFTVVLVEK